MSGHIRAHNSRNTGVIRGAVGLGSIALLLFVIGCGGGPSRAPRTATPTPDGQTPAPSATLTAEEVFAPPPSLDLMDVARRYRGYPADGPSVVRTEPFGHQLGDVVEFQVVDFDYGELYPVSAVLARITDHAYHFVDEEYPADDATMDQIAADFESVIWPTVTTAFGEPNTPGVDGDPRITILNTPLNGAGGYVSYDDAYPFAVGQRNERDMVYIDGFLLAFGGQVYNGVLAHELQHLVHFNQDTSEESWVNEGLSEVAWEMVGGDTDAIAQYMAAPDVGLRQWTYRDDPAIHYAVAELFMGYVLDHYGGRNNAKVLAAEQANGITGVEAYLQTFGTNFDNVFADFMAANVLDLADGPYSHLSYGGETAAIEKVGSGDGGNTTVAQFGIDYYAVEGGQTFTFNGADIARGSIPALDGAYWATMHGDGIDARLTREIDLTGVASATLTFNVWFDIEYFQDYGYVSVSTDSGATWTSLRGQQSVSREALYRAVGPGYTGSSGGWLKERIDLSTYAGQRVLLRFEYMTDQSTNLEGLAIDNVEIAEIGLLDKADVSEGWVAEGFRRVGDTTPQTFSVVIIGDDDSVRRVQLSPGSQAEIEIEADSTVAIAGTTRESTGSASYSWSVR